MNTKEFLKPTAFKVLIFLFVAVFYLYFAKEDACAVGFDFSFCYHSYGFPFFYIIKGDINNASDYIKGLFLGKYFSKHGNFLINPMSLVIDILLIYLLACFISLLFVQKKFKI